MGLQRWVSSSYGRRAVESIIENEISVCKALVDVWSDIVENQIGRAVVKIA
jgi:hypothetical protein